MNAKRGFDTEINDSNINLIGAVAKHITSISNGTFSSQSNFSLHNNWKIVFTRAVTEEINPNGS